MEEKKQANHGKRHESWEVIQLNQLKSKAWRAFIKEQGERYKSCRISNFEVSLDSQKQAVEKLSEFLANINQHCDAGCNLILAGPPGTGKDHLLVACVFEAIKSGAVLNVRSLSGPRLFSDLRTAISAQRPENDVLNDFIRCDLLVISDIAMHGATKYQKEIIYKIIDERYRAKLPIFFSTNATSRQALEELTSAQIVDRLSHDAIYVPCNWPSYRTKTL